MRGEFDTYEQAFARMMQLAYTAPGVRTRPVVCEIRRTAKGKYQLIEVSVDGQ